MYGAGKTKFVEGAFAGLAGGLLILALGVPARGAESSNDACRAGGVLWLDRLERSIESWPTTVKFLKATVPETYLPERWFIKGPWVCSLF
jgi:hypothetical protein